MRKPLISVSLIIAMMVVVAGFSCSNGHAAIAMRDVAASVKAFQAAEINLHQQGKISDPAHLDIQRLLKGVAVAGQGIDHCATNGGGPACVDVGVAAANDLLNLGVTHITDDATRQQLQLAVQLIITSLNNAKAVL